MEFETAFVAIVAIGKNETFVALFPIACSYVDCRHVHMLLNMCKR